MGWGDFGWGMEVSRGPSLAAAGSFSSSWPEALWDLCRGQLETRALVAREPGAKDHRGEFAWASPRRDGALWEGDCAGKDVETCDLSLWKILKLEALVWWK